MPNLSQTNWLNCDRSPNIGKTNSQTSSAVQASASAIELILPAYMVGGGADAMQTLVTNKSR
jgi:hypothetical protein